MNTERYRGLRGAPASTHLVEPQREASERRISRDIAWTFVVSIATVPFGYLITLVLARVSPAALGAFGVLGIYLGVVVSFLYFGGGTVSVRFTTELPSDSRLSFFVSYLGVTLAVLAGAIVIATAFPATLSYLVGHQADARLVHSLLLAAPIPLFYSAADATLRGVLRIGLAQTLARAITVLACMVYTAAWLFFADFFHQNYVLVIVGTYLVLMLFAGAIAFRVIRLSSPKGITHIRWFLPAGFWRFATTVQTNSMLAFAQNKIDQLLVLGSLGISDLGIYFAILQLAEGAGLVAGFLLEGVFPLVMRFNATHEPERIRRLYHESARQILFIHAALTFALLAFIRPVLGIFGREYLDAAPILILLLAFCSLDSLGPLNHTLIVGMSKMTPWTVVQVLRLAGFVVGSLALFGHLGMLGVVLARGVAWTLAGALAYWIVLRRLPLRPRVPWAYVWQLLLTMALAELSLLRIHTPDLWSDFLSFGITFATFCLLGRYSLQEFTWLFSSILGGSKHDRRTLRVATPAVIQAKSEQIMRPEMNAATQDQGVRR